MPSEQQSTAETWYVTVNASDSGRQKLHKRGCQNAPAEIQEATESQKDALDKCKYCSGKTDSGDNYREEECWKCGDTFGNLPIHIRSCDG